MLHSDSLDINKTIPIPHHLKALKDLEEAGIKQYEISIVDFGSGQYNSWALSPKDLSPIRALYGFRLKLKNHRSNIS